MSMFKGLVNTSFLTKKNIMVIAVVAVLIIGVYSYSNSKSSFFDGMAENSGISTGGSTTTVPAVDSAAAAPVVVAPVQPQGSGYSQQKVANPSELLPKDSNSSWSSLNPVASSGVLMPDLLNPAGFMVGLNTTSQSMKNPNLQLRSEPSVTKIAGLSPWNNSSIEPDLARVPLEVGFTHA